VRGVCQALFGVAHGRGEVALFGTQIGEYRGAPQAIRSPGPRSTRGTSPLRTTGPSATAAPVPVCRRRWNSGLTANITLTDTGTTAIDGWSLGFTLPGGQTCTYGWNAAYSPASARVTAANASRNATIAPGTSVGIGFRAIHTGNAASPDTYTLNGTACAPGSAALARVLPATGT
jgi:hypothetical protein